MLTLISTPIGNLKDITLRALEELRQADLILCEDTRVSSKLLKHFEIECKTQSFHKFNESKAEEQVISKLESGLKVALISDAGTPAINDPGMRLVQTCIQKGIEVTACPGPASPIVALTLSGLDTARFQFLGFTPKKKGERMKFFAEALDYPGTTITFESPERIKDSLELLTKLTPNRPLAIARELTKKFEEILRGTSSELLEKVQSNPLRGEIILMLSGVETPDWDHLSPKDHVLQLKEEFDLSDNDAIKLAANLRGIQKRSLYSEVKLLD